MISGLKNVGSHKLKPHKENLFSSIKIPYTIYK